MKLKPLVWKDYGYADFINSCYDIRTWFFDGRVSVAYYNDTDLVESISTDAGSVDNAKALAQEHAQKLFDKWVEQYVDFSKPPLEWETVYDDLFWQAVEKPSGYRYVVSVNTDNGGYWVHTDGWCGGDMFYEEIGNGFNTLEEAKAAVEQYRNGE